MQRLGLVGGWNVREARAVPTVGGGGAGMGAGRDQRTPSVRVVAGGHALSWRWLLAAEAEALLDERLGRLETMGYTLVDSGMAARGRWDWLHDLVHRQLARPSGPGDDPQTAPVASAALHDALCDLGLSAAKVVEGVAAVLGIPPHELTEPTLETVHATDPDHLAVLLPFLLHHDTTEVRAIGERWLRTPTVIYQVPASVMMRWLEGDMCVARLIAPRLNREALALLGADRLTRLTRTGTPPARDAAKHWMRRLR